MTQPTTDKARTRLAAFLGYEPGEHDALFESHLDALVAAVRREDADLIDAETAALKADGVLEPDRFRPCRDASAQLRRMAEEARS